jgi:hypothetical protein
MAAQAQAAIGGGGTNQPKVHYSPAHYSKHYKI